LGLRPGAWGLGLGRKPSIGRDFAANFRPLAPADAFGEPDPSLLRTIGKSDFPPGVKVGGQLELPGPQGEPHPFTVMKVKGDTVLLDGNHPLAGRTLKLAITVTEIRAASAEEVAHGHAHGAHGHHH
jgi:FKBP-type peptidyl-prolyl cis-trans isomerase SlyD